MRQFIAGFCWIQIGWLVALTGCATSQPSRFVAWTIVAPSTADSVSVEDNALVLQGGMLRTEKTFDSPIVTFDYRLVSETADNAVLTVACVTAEGTRQILVEVAGSSIGSRRSWNPETASAPTDCGLHSCQIQIEARPTSARWEIRNFVVK